MKKKLLGIFVCTLLIATAILPLVSALETRSPLLTPGVVDQEQPNTPEVHWLEANVFHWQQFVNQGNKLEEVELHIGCWFSGSYPITLSIQEPLGTNLTHVTYQASDFPLDVQAWFTFDVPDVQLTRGRTYYICLYFNSGSEYGWSGSHNDPYPDGESSHTDQDWDYAFRTIVDKSKPRNMQMQSPGVVDQQQPNTPELDWLDAGVPNWQQFVNQGNMLEEVELHIGQYMTFSQDITLSIVETLGGPILTTVTYPANALPLNTQGWFVFNVTDVQLTRGNKYYIVVEFNNDSEYAWSGAHGDPYILGASSHPDLDWDYAFRTIVDKSKPFSINQLFLRFLEQHPRIFPILRHMLGL